MKIKSGYMVRPVAGSYVVVATGEKTVDFNGIMTLNEDGSIKEFAEKPKKPKSTKASMGIL